MGDHCSVYHISLWSFHPHLTITVRDASDKGYQLKACLTSHNFPPFLVDMIS